MGEVTSLLLLRKETEVGIAVEGLKVVWWLA
jgi:hypothetical protein